MFVVLCKKNPSYSAYPRKGGNEGVCASTSTPTAISILRSHERLSESSVSEIEGWPQSKTIHRMNPQDGEKKQNGQHQIKHTSNSEDDVDTAKFICDRGVVHYLNVANRHPFTYTGVNINTTPTNAFTNTKVDDINEDCSETSGKNCSQVSASSASWALRPRTDDTYLCHPPHMYQPYYYPPHHHHDQRHQRRRRNNSDDNNYLRKWQVPEQVQVQPQAQAQPPYEYASLASYQHEHLYPKNNDNVTDAMIINEKDGDKVKDESNTTHRDLSLRRKRIVGTFTQKKIDPTVLVAAEVDENKSASTLSSPSPSQSPPESNKRMKLSR